MGVGFLYLEVVFLEYFFKSRKSEDGFVAKSGIFLFEGKDLVD